MVLLLSRKVKKNAKKANKEMCGQNTITPGNAHMSLS